MQRILIGPLPVMKRAVFNTIRKQIARGFSGNTHVSLAVQGHDYVFVFSRSQGDSSIRINCIKTNGESAVLLGSSDKVIGNCSEEETGTLA
jgi:hypothetical protein